jgi:hypothetical protein
VFLIESVFENGGKYTESVKQEFRNQFPDTREPHHDTVWNLVSKFCETGSVQDVPRSGRLSVLSQEKLDDISDQLLQSSKKSLRELAQESEPSYGST